MNNEVWRTYPEFSWIQGSSLGRVRTIDRWVTYKNGKKRLYKGDVLKRRRNRGGYMQVKFSVNGKQVHRYVHRIIASAFLPNPFGLKEVNHIDCDRTDNHLNNLEWCTREYNIQYREKCGVSMTEAQGHTLLVVNLETQEVYRFQSQREAGRELGVNQSTIGKVLKGRYSQTGGYWFTNADENAIENVRAKFGDSVADKVEKLMTDKELQPA